MLYSKLIGTISSMLPARGCLCIEDNADHDVGDLAADM